MTKSTVIVGRSPRIPTVTPYPGAADGVLSGLRVLVVDEDTEAAGAVAAHLSIAGADVRACNGSGAALDSWAAFRPHALVVETDLGGMDGHGLARWVREEPDGRLLLLVALSELASGEAVRASLAAGFDVHLRKPADRETLVALVAGFGFKCRLDAVIPAG